MKGVSYGTRGVAVVLAGWFAYINTNFTPLFWVLLALIAVDLVLNVHKEEKQLSKIGSAFMSAGFPYLITQSTHLELAIRAAVLMGVVVYIQIVFPQLFAVIAKWKPKTAQGKYTQAEVEALLAEAQKAATTAVVTEAKKDNVPLPPTNPGSSA